MSKTRRVLKFRLQLARPSERVGTAATGRLEVRLERLTANWEGFHRRLRQRYVSLEEKP